jgi:hypothetical protein
MKSKWRKTESNEKLDAMAMDTTDVRPMTAAMRRKWEAAKRTGAKVSRGRPRKAERDKSRIVPVSIEPRLLEAVDKYAKNTGISRSRLVSEGLRMRMKA